MTQDPPWFLRPGRLCLAASLLTMYFWCMLLPLVGRAGAWTPHARENFLTVLGVLILALGFSVAGALRQRHAHPESAWPVPAVLLAVSQLFLGILLVAGAFGV